MKSKLLLTLLTCACASLVARADFNPVAITPSSFTLDIVVPASTTAGLPDCITVTAGGGSAKGDTTFFEQGVYIRTNLSNQGIPQHNTVFTNINNTNMLFVMPPAYSGVNNDLMIDASHASGTMTLITPATATNLAVLCTSGGGAATVHYIVTHADASTEAGTLSLLDWFGGGAAVAWGANGRVGPGGGLSNINLSTTNNNPPYFYGLQITVSGASPVTSVEFDSASGNHPNFLAISANSTGTWAPAPLTSDSFNEKMIEPATIPLLPFPVTGTMDRGVNLNSANGMNTWFEQGFFRTLTSSGLPAGNAPFNSVSQPTHHYQFAPYNGNNAILIDTNHQLANIGLVTPSAYTGLAFLTAGGGEGAGNIMSNICIIQHLDGVNETNVFLGFDWFDTGQGGALAYQANGRVDMSCRAVNSFTDARLFPYLFESYFLLTDTTSAVTNVVVKFGTAPNATCTTFVMAISGTTDGVPAVVTSGPNPSSQTVVPGANVTFSVGVSGTQPITGFWQVQNAIDGSFTPLTDGVDVNGSTITGSHSLTLSISNVFVADGTNYQFVAHNAFGDNTSPNGLLTVTPETPSITPIAPVGFTHNNLQLSATVTAGPPVQYQWFVIDNSAISNVIANATNSTYTIPNVDPSMSGFVYGITVWNVYGTNSTMTSPISVSDSAAFLGGDLSPTNAEAYAGAQVTYGVDAQGNTPIFYRWTTNGVVVTGVNSNRLTLTTPCGLTSIQVSFSNALSGGVLVNSTAVQLQGDGSPLNLGFNTSGTGWQTNGTLAGITNNTLLLTDGNGGETSSAFYTVAQYVGGSWNASFLYNSHGGGADGTAFILQTTNPAAIGGGGGQLGYTGIAGNSLAYEINIYNGGVIGGTLASNGASGTYQSVAPVNVGSTNDILVNLSWSSGVLTVTLTDQGSLATFTTNYNVGSLSALLGGNLAYIGFSGADGGVASTQTVRNFQFHSVLPSVKLTTAVGVAGAFNITWPSADPSYVLQTNSSLTNPTGWAAAPLPVTANGTNTVTVNPASGSSQLFYRLLRVACP
ncbi:MAG TPA: hypothetical protein VH597_11445 [Verrucomicrobiae bacterium]|jgi:hypothetical protein|nr:hypothetical protein [Verrucomicrobiae bacterium]